MARRYAASQRKRVSESRRRRVNQKIPTASDQALHHHVTETHTRLHACASGIHRCLSDPPELRIQAIDEGRCTGSDRRTVPRLHMAERGRQRAALPSRGAGHGAPVDTVHLPSADAASPQCARQPAAAWKGWCACSRAREPQGTRPPSQAGARALYASMLFLTPRPHPPSAVRHRAQLSQ